MLSSLFALTPFEACCSPTPSVHQGSKKKREPTAGTVGVGEVRDADEKVDRQNRAHTELRLVSRDRGTKGKSGRAAGASVAMMYVYGCFSAPNRWSPDPGWDGMDGMGGWRHGGMDRVAQFPSPTLTKPESLLVALPVQSAPRPATSDSCPRFCHAHRPGSPCVRETDENLIPRAVNRGWHWMLGALSWVLPSSSPGASQQARWIL